MMPRTIVKNGHKWKAHDQDAAFWNRVEEGTWEPLTFSVFDRFLDAEHSYLDIGAWIGPTVLYGASVARHCYAMEPDPLAYSELCRNVDLNASIKDRVTLSRQCLAAACGPVRLGNKTSSRGGDSMSSLLFADSRVSWEAEGVTLERFFSDNHICDCSFIKMDIEGGEFEVLPAIAGYLAEQRPTVYLSLHPRFLAEPESGTAAIKKVLECYRHVYTPDLHAATLNVLSDPMTFQWCYELVFSDIDCL
jgi:FkbM family methyltransferase